VNKAGSKIVPLSELTSPRGKKQSFGRINSMKRLPKEFTYPVALVMIIDFLITIVGQPKNYWNNFANVNEGSPIGFSLMKINPLFFLLFCAIYLLIAIISIKKLPLFLGATIALSLFLGHAYGSSTWVYYFFYRGGLTSEMFSHWYITIGYFVLLSLFSVFIIFKKKKHSN
jgi:hypothetical protein